MALVVAALVLLQLAAYGAHQFVEQRRATAETRRAFAYEALSPQQRGLDVPLLTPDGATHTLRRFRGAPLLVHFWATWCAPCRTELPQLLQVEKNLHVRLVLVSVDANWGVIRHFFENDVPPVVVLDESGRARGAFGVSTLPDTYLLDSEGRTVARFHGPRDWADMKPELLQSLAGSPAD